MKLKVVISYCLLAVYSLALAHTIIPHDHCEQTAAGQEIMICVHDDAHDHDEPHHDESQHIDEYTFKAANPVLQLAFQPIICRKIPIFDLSLVVCDIQKQDFYFVPPKIPKQFAEAVPLRAPPFC
ncbi:MAG: hypothetical protein LBD53_11625 [Tannerella sp.]|jgi:hypothetical protein|nr:hypothetical protein [Tannerella sp.]